MEDSAALDANADHRPNLSISQMLSRRLSGVSQSVRESIVSLGSGPRSPRPGTSFSIRSVRSIRTERNSLYAATTRGNDGDETDVEKNESVESPPARRPGETPAAIARQARRPARDSPLHLLNLPHELQLMILEHLDFGDLERLRRTCKFYRNLATPRAVRTRFGGPAAMIEVLLSHCGVCLRHDPLRHVLLRTHTREPGYPLSGRCFDCAAEARDPRLKVGRQVLLGDGSIVWVCRWCGRPVTENQLHQFHSKCHRNYITVFRIFVLLGFLQMGLGVTVAALCFRYFRSDRLVFPTVLTAFLLHWICFVVIFFRGHNIRTYHYTFLLEFAILALWMPPAVSLGLRLSYTSKRDVTTHTIATFILILLNLFFRFMNCLGNITLAAEYDWTKFYRPGDSRVRRYLLNPVIATLIFWTYPQAVEQKYPGQWV